MRSLSGPLLARADSDDLSTEYRFPSNDRRDDYKSFTFFLQQLLEGDDH